MKNYLNKIIIPILLILIIFFTYTNKSKIKNPIFVGHVYGTSKTKDIPYKPLENVVKKNNLDFIIFGGDITKNQEDFKLFDNHFLDIKKLYIKGNHDGDLYQKIEPWEKKVFKNLEFINLSNKEFLELYKFDYSKYNNTYFISHYNWFEKIFKPLNSSNQIFSEEFDLKFDQIKKFGKNNKFISGDCGKYSNNPPYILAKMNGNSFLCTGLGEGSNNFVILPTLKPLFFDNEGKIIKHYCKKRQNKKKIIKICSTKKKHLIKLTQVF
jgi:hypothetical protein